MISSEQWELFDLLVEKGQASEVDVDEVLSAAHFILHDQDKLLEAGLEIIDVPEDAKHHAVRAYCHEDSERRFWKVLGSHEAEYLCFQRFCSCPFYMNTLRTNPVIDGNSRIICKHLIAIRLASALRRVEVLRLPVERFMASVLQDSSGQVVQPHMSFSTPYHHRRK